MNMQGEIRRTRLRHGLSRNTDRRWLKSAEGIEPKYRSKAQPTLLAC